VQLAVDAAESSSGPENALAELRQAFEHLDASVVQQAGAPPLGRPALSVTSNTCIAHPRHLGGVQRCKVANRDIRVWHGATENGP
jgi:hypothetical protein